MNLSKFMLAMVCAALSGTTATVAAPVKVEGGLVEGSFENGLAVYLGIPFAAPPVGNLRWRAPQPPSKWQGVLRADKFAAKCMQGGSPTSPGVAQAPDTSEDCLYLNVWSPAKSAGERLPVLVWIYGGGFSGGATSIPTYSGEQLARRGVVLVSIAYRVGPFGFLAHPALSAESRNHVSGNYGLLDMIAGLQWIQKNIAAFGGDPRRVTIFGESAGGIAVSMLCASPLAKDLFHGAISQSGGSFGPPRVGGMPGENMVRLADAERAGEAYAKSAGVSSIEALRKLPADQVLATTKGQPGLGWPIIDRWVIPDDQYKLYQARRYNDTPILVGYNSDEGLSFSVAHTPEAYVKYVRERFGPHADNLLKLYPVGTTVVTKSARDLMRDAAFGWHTWIWARLHTQAGKSKAFYYYFDQHPPRVPGSPEEDQGSRHGLDVPYVFQHFGQLKPPATAADQMISDAMATYWTNFAKRGDPNGSGVPNWPDFSDANPVVMYLRQPPHTGPVPSEEGLKGLDAYFAWRRTPEGEAAVQSEASASADTPQMGIAVKKPVFGGAFKICPWGAMAEAVQAAMKPYGYDVQICYNCNAAAALSIMGGLAMSADAAGRAAKTFRDCETCPEMVVIPPGTFIMGSPETEKNRDKDEGEHKVTIAYSFAVSKGPITWDQWEACARDAMCDGQAVETALRLDREGKPIQNYADHGRGNHPVVGVSWWDAQVFIGWLNKKTGKEKYRLLSESEFEYAARAGTTTAYWWGNEPSHDYANYGKEVGQDLGGVAAGRDIWEDSTSPICSFPTNAFGLCDMHGNIYQWIEDCYETNIALLPTDGSAVKSGNCAVRGFRSNSFESNPKSLRSANRAFVYAPNTRGRNYLGFRVAKTLK